MSKNILDSLINEFEQAIAKTATTERSEYNREAHILRVSVASLMKNILSQFPKSKKLSDEKLKRLTELAKEACKAIYKEVVKRQNSTKYNNYTYKILSATSVAESTSKDTFRVFIVSNTGKGRPFNQANDIKYDAEQDLSKKIQEEFNVKVGFDLGHDYSVAEHVRDEILLKFSQIDRTAASIGTSISNVVGYSTLIKMSAKATAKQNAGKTFMLKLVEEYPDLEELVKKGIIKPEDGALISTAAEDFRKNRAKGATKETSALNRVKDLSKNILPRIDFLRGTGSPSRLDIIYSEIAKTIKKHNGRTKTKIVKDSSSKSPERKIKGTKVELKVNSKVTSESSILPKINIVDTKQKASTKKDWSSLINIINKKLPEQVARNMGKPGLVYRTGRFANSAEVVNIQTTKEGYPSIVYNYQRSPYDVFDRTKGAAPWNTPARDPKTLVDKSIREIVQEMAIGRFYTRRA